MGLAEEKKQNQTNFLHQEWKKVSRREEKIGHMQCPSTHFYKEPEQKKTQQQTVPRSSCATRKQRLPRLGACRVIVAVTQERRLSCKASQYTALAHYCFSAPLARSTHALLKSQIGKRSCSAQRSFCVSITPFCTTVAAASVPCHSPSAARQELVPKGLFHQTALPPQPPG